ncbi:hypothetical protein SAMD00019534_103040 [Acytostelium subglobosum LB1]|uniref:hypothetical protein n=1 Tax=Acytostelium subglobosum LB1 TaxID=1410327 RepID=UPI000644CDF8|nr:hypothetical protein SAMD00019534_103040 [Acytostelium subglobosum LB1]GAM27129.1 hypothetical protein SAMD00019534_103040 [Acytostelium subglobosum LB1]|eukprot:XP_012750009.1 hypothetical protein SAMD00019534_103040 [Acytostelium subglobosum LB1]
MDEGALAGYTHFIRYLNYATTPKFRMAFETFCLIVIATFLFSLVAMHRQYVGKADCIVDEFEANFPKHRFDILLLDIKEITTDSNEDDQYQQEVTEIFASSQTSLMQKDLINKLLSTDEMQQQREEQQHTTAASEAVTTETHHQPDEASRPSHHGPVVGVSPNQRVRHTFETHQQYEFSTQKGFLMLSPDVRSMYNISTHRIDLYTNQSCFGGPFHRMLLKVLGYDTVIINNLVNSFDGSGYLRSLDDNILINLSRFSSPETHLSSDYILYVIQCIIKVNIIFFLNVTVFGVGLRICEQCLTSVFDSNSHGLQTFMLHNCCVALLQIGMIYMFSIFLSAEYLVFLSISLIASYFTSWSLRSNESIRCYPLIFLATLYFLGYYVTIFPTGFHSIAFCVTYTITEYLVVLCIFNFEIPAVLGPNRDVQNNQIVQREQHIQ